MTRHDNTFHFSFFIFHFISFHFISFVHTYPLCTQKHKRQEQNIVPPRSNRSQGKKNWTRWTSLDTTSPGNPQVDISIKNCHVNAMWIAMFVYQTLVSDSALQVTLTAFENELGVQAPVGFWDPVGFTSDGDVATFKRRRSVELKHGRISMMATMGFLVAVHDNSWEFMGVHESSLDVWSLCLCHVDPICAMSISYRCSKIISTCQCQCRLLSFESVAAAVFQGYITPEITGKLFGT